MAKARIVEALSRMLGGRLSQAEREQIADEAIAIIKAENVEVAKLALDVVQKTAEETKT